MAPKVFIDGEAGTTGLQILDRLANRTDLSLLHLNDAERKDSERRKAMLNEADLAILCLPDDAARESVLLIENPDTKVIDASTAHRTSDGWAFGFPEYEKGHRGKIASAKRVANPGCYAICSIAILHPLIVAGLIKDDWPITINAISGYSGGGKSLIAEFEGSSSSGYSKAPFFTYGHNLAHKHVPEITRWSGLKHAPIFVPSVGQYAQGMIVQVPLPLWAMSNSPSPKAIHTALQDHYAGEEFVTVTPLQELEAIERLAPEALNGTNKMQLYVFTNEGEGEAVVMALVDNLGKGASGQAVQNLNIMLGLGEATGL